MLALRIKLTADCTQVFNPFPMKTHPIRFLLYLEWIALSIVALSTFFRTSFLPIAAHTGFNLVALVSFGILGLILPRKNLIYQFGYVVLELVLIVAISPIDRMRLPLLLYVIVIIRNCIIFNTQTRWIINGCIYLFVCILLAINLYSHFPFLPHPPPPMRGIEPDRIWYIWLNFAVLFGLVVVFIQLLVNAILSDRTSKAELAIANDRLRQYALRIEDLATLQERNRIAREIHDSLGHYLTILNINLEAAWKLQNTDPNSAATFLADAKAMGSTALEEVRQSVAKLRSDPLKNRSLSEALETAIADFQKSTNLVPQLQIHLNSAPSDLVKTALYRIVQEALTNIYKYAEATEVKIQIENDRCLTLTIQDNGKGFDPDRNTTGFGLQGMRERTIALGGTFQILTAPDRGCRIVATFPISPISQ
jgi:signal transduction histidine kinase